MNALATNQQEILFQLPVPTAIPDDQHDDTQELQVKFDQVHTLIGAIEGYMVIVLVFTVAPLVWFAGKQDQQYHDGEFVFGLTAFVVVGVFVMITVLGAVCYGCKVQRAGVQKCTVTPAYVFVTQYGVQKHIRLERVRDVTVAKAGWLKRTKLTIHVDPELHPEEPETRQPRDQEQAEGGEAEEEKPSKRAHDNDIHLLGVINSQEVRKFIFAKQKISRRNGVIPIVQTVVDEPEVTLEELTRLRERLAHMEAEYTKQQTTRVSEAERHSTCSPILNLQQNEEAQAASGQVPVPAPMPPSPTAPCDDEESFHYVVPVHDDDDEQQHQLHARPPPSPSAPDHGDAQEDDDLDLEILDQLPSPISVYVVHRDLDLDLDG